MSGAGAHATASPLAVVTQTRLVSETNQMSVSAGHTGCRWQTAGTLVTHIFSSGASTVVMAVTMRHSSNINIDISNLNTRPAPNTTRVSAEAWPLTLAMARTPARARKVGMSGYDERARRRSRHTLTSLGDQCPGNTCSSLYLTHHCAACMETVVCHSMTIDMPREGAAPAGGV